MKNILTLCSAILLLAALAPVSPSLAADDPVFQAMSDELERSMDQLVIEGMAKPYFLSYLVQDNDVSILEARYGAILNRETSRDRYLYVELRVGDPSLDNIGYIAFNMFSLWMFGSAIALLWGEERFLRYYLVCGVGAGFLIASVPVMVHWLGISNPNELFGRTLGASGADFGARTATEASRSNEESVGASVI